MNLNPRNIINNPPTLKPKPKTLNRRYSPHADHQTVITNLIKPLLEAPPLAMDCEF